MIPYGRQHIDSEDISSVIDVLKSNFLTQGPVVPEFEKNISSICGVDYAIATNSATSALHLACLSLGLKKGDIVWTTPISFVASSNCALYCGASVDFVDIDPDTYNLSIDALSKKLEEAKIDDKLPNIVIPVHFSGMSCNMKKLHELSMLYGFKIIEDASHAIGSRYEGERVGSCRYSDITVFSFHPVKIITTGEGGCAVTNNDLLAKSMEINRSHGITRNEFEMTHASDGPWYYQQLSLGYNYRMTDIQAALGLSQLEKLDKFIKTRQDIASRYQQLLSDLPIFTPAAGINASSSFHLYVIGLNLKAIKKGHKQIFSEMRELGVGVNLHYIPIYHHPFYESLGFRRGYCKNAETYYSRSMSLPIYYDLTEKDQMVVVDALRQVIE